MVYWRFKSKVGGYEYRFGYVTYISGHNMIRMGRWNGDTTGGPIVDCNEIEWQPYTDHLRRV